MSRRLARTREAALNSLQGISGKRAAGCAVRLARRRPGERSRLLACRSPAGGGVWRPSSSTEPGGALAYDTGKDTRTLAALVLARIGQRRRALEFANRLERQFRANTLLQSYWLPTVRAAAALESGRAKQALEFLQIVSSYDLASPEPPGEAYLYPVLLRGLAYLQLKQSDQAEIQFRKILDHPRIALSLPVGAKARLGLARSYALKANTTVVTVREHENSEQSGSHDQSSHQADLLKARDAYQRFFALWADDGIPVVREARIEYRHLH